MLSYIQNNIELQIFIYSMVPIIELRGTIPYFVLLSELHWFKIFIIAVFSNVTIGIIVRYLISPIMIFLNKFHLFSLIIRPILRRTNKKLYKIEKYKMYGLILFIGIPLPITGVWTGSLASYLLSMSFPKSIISIIFGSLLSGIIITFITLTSIELASSFIPAILK